MKTNGHEERRLAGSGQKKQLRSDGYASLGGPPTSGPFFRAFNPAMRTANTTVREKSRFVTHQDLVADLRALSVPAGATIMVHAAMSKVGRLLNGPDALIGALLNVVGPDGTVMAYTDWDARYDELLDAEGRVPDAWREAIPPFDPQRSRAIRDNGILPEFIRTTPGARRSSNPGASVAALGARADWLTADHPLDYGYGAGSPLAKLVECDGLVLMIGAPWDTMTLLHHAEHLANIPSKRIRRSEVPFASPDGTVWRMVEEFETSEPVAPGLDEEYFAEVVAAFVVECGARQGPIGNAHSLLVSAAAIVSFAVRWLESRVR